MDIVAPFEGNHCLTLLTAVRPVCVKLSQVERPESCAGAVEWERESIAPLSTGRPRPFVRPLGILGQTQIPPEKLTINWQKEIAAIAASAHSPAEFHI